MSLDDEDVVDLLNQAKSAGRSEPFNQSIRLLKEAKMYGLIANLRNM